MTKFWRFDNFRLCSSQAFMFFLIYSKLQPKILDKKVRRKLKIIIATHLRSGNDMWISTKPIIRYRPCKFKYSLSISLSNPDFIGFSRGSACGAGGHYPPTLDYRNTSIISQAQILSRSTPHPTVVVLPVKSSVNTWFAQNFANCCTKINLSPSSDGAVWTIAA